jgi:site-specific DNA-methyltransferase (adenine-specific)/modification methylase
VSDIVQIGDATLYHGDCLEILPTLDKVDAVVTDPPYGIGMHGGKIGRAEYEVMSEWDSRPADVTPILELNVPSIIWGGNYFKVPPSKSWLVWDKETQGVTTFADCELAWSNLDQAVRMVRHLWSGPYMRVKEKRYHPTQKPARVMEWSIGFTDGETILDPFMGSGTTGVACANLGRKFIGIEIERKYFDIACERIEAAYAQGRLFA